jgi:hypothetical protein
MAMSTCDGSIERYKAFVKDRKSGKLEDNLPPLCTIQNPRLTMATECRRESQMFKTLFKRPTGAKVFDKEYGGAGLVRKRALSPTSDINGVQDHRTLVDLYSSVQCQRRFNTTMPCVRT